MSRIEHLLYTDEEEDMSSDNFYEVDYRPDLNKQNPWAVTMGFASDDYPEEGLASEQESVFFYEARNAEKYAASQYSEYGVVLGPNGGPNRRDA